MTALPICERLRKRIVPDNLLASMDEAADTIAELYAALDGLLSIFERVAVQDDDVSAIGVAYSVLSRARGE